MISGYESYRDPEARKLMLEFVVGSRGIDPQRALAALRELNHVGLAHVYRDALSASQQGSRIDYDPCGIVRL